MSVLLSASSTGGMDSRGFAVVVSVELEAGSRSAPEAVAGNSRRRSVVSEKGRTESQMFVVVVPPEGYIRQTQLR